MINIYEQLVLGVKIPGEGREYKTGELINFLLLMEKPKDRAGIISSVAKTMGLSLKDFSDEYTKDLCDICGMELADHIEGECP